MSSKNYSIPLSSVRREHEVLRSRFIATLAPAFSSEEARAFIAGIRAEFSNASHNVPAYIIGGGNTVMEYFSDDGEPAGTAGKPVLTVLRGSGFGDAVLVVTRYFGGTLLGTGGLVKAYTEAAQSVVHDAARGKRIRVHVIMLAAPYNFLERLRLLASKHKGIVDGEDFAADVTMTLRLPHDHLAEFSAELQEISAGALRAEVIETRDEIFPAG